ncbi:MFS transporter [Glutamicibacter sp. NPDC087344]|uniref:MFS transporter n=1 Tax=Glutamicibacter sp. NPDC087344 TaxID=3363994 RepID=UPI003808C3F1
MTNRARTSATRPGTTVGILATAGIASALTQTMVSPLIPQLPEIFNTSAENTAWIITATLLAGAVAVPVSGRLGDLFGKRRMILILALPLIIGGLVCAAAPNVTIMIIGRALQGFGSGMIPLGIAMLRDLVPKEQLSSAIATVSATLGAGGAIGLPVSAAVIEFSNWRWLFIGGSVVSLIVALLIWKFIPGSKAGAAGQRFDWLGAIGLSAGILSLMLAISKGSSWGWASPLTLGLFGLALLALVSWGFWELRATDPLVDLRTAVISRVLLTNIASIFVGFGMYVSMLLMPQILQLPESTGYGLGQSVLAAGLWAAPAGFMMLILSPVGGKLSDKRGAKFTLLVGIIILAAGYLVGQWGMGSTWGLLITAVIINSGVAFAYGAMPSLIMSSVPRSETAAANGFNTLMRSLGTTGSAAVIGLVLAQMSTDFHGTLIPTEQGFRTALILGAAFSLAAVLVAIFIPKNAPRSELEPVDVPLSANTK